MSFDTKTKRFMTAHALELAYLAALVAVEAPVHANAHSSTAKISWELVDRIRAALDADGFDWRSAAAKQKVLAHAKSALASTHTRRAHERRAMTREIICQYGNCLEVVRDQGLSVTLKSKDSYDASKAVYCCAAHAALSMLRLAEDRKEIGASDWEDLKSGLPRSWKTT